MQLMCVFREFADPLALARGTAYRETIRREGKILVEILNFSPDGAHRTIQSASSTQHCYMVLFDCGE